MSSYYYCYIFPDLRGTNVTSTKELLKLCSSSVKSKYLHYVSSHGIFPFSERVNETTLVDKERYFFLNCVPLITSVYCLLFWLNNL